MSTLPQLTEEDIRVLTSAMDDLISKSEATSAMVLDKGGFLISERGDTQFDSTTLGALGAACYAATQGIASLVGEANFSNVYQQGESYSLLVSNIDEHCLLVVIFKAQISVGAVKYYAMTAIGAVAQQLEIARGRSDEDGLDLSVLDIADTGDIFARGSSEPEPAPQENERELQSLFSRRAAESNAAPEVAPEAAAVEGEAGDPMLKLQKIKKLLASGLITEEDFEFKKRKILEEL